MIWAHWPVRMPAGATFLEATRLQTLEAAPAGSTVPFRPRFRATGASRTMLFHRTVDEIQLLLLSPPDAASERLNPPRRRPGTSQWRPGTSQWCSKTTPGAPRDLPRSTPRRPRSPPDAPQASRHGLFALAVSPRSLQAASEVPPRGLRRPFWHRFDVAVASLRPAT